MVLDEKILYLRNKKIYSKNLRKKRFFLSSPIHQLTLKNLYLNKKYNKKLGELVKYL